MKGVNFFLYTDKYNSIYNYLFFDDLVYESDEIKKFRSLYNKIYSNINKYLKYFFELLSVIYYDKFDEKEIFKFALYLDYFIGNIRINLKRITKESIAKIIRDNRENILDYILLSFDVNDIFDFLKSNAKGINNETINEAIEKNGIIYRYIKSYFDFINFKNADIKSIITSERKNIDNLIKNNNFKVDNYE